MAEGRGVRVSSVGAWERVAEGLRAATGGCMETMLVWPSFCTVLPASAPQAGYTSP